MSNNLKDKDNFLKIYNQCHGNDFSEMFKKEASKRNSNLYAQKIFKEIKYAIDNNPGNLNKNNDLKLVVFNAKKNYISDIEINQAIKNSKSKKSLKYQIKFFEGFGPNESKIIVETIASDERLSFLKMREFFSKWNCKLGSQGDVHREFKYCCLFEVQKDDIDNVMEWLVSINIIVDELVNTKNSALIYCPISMYFKIRDAIFDDLSEPFFSFIRLEKVYKPIKLITLFNENEAESFYGLINDFENLAIIRSIYHNVQFGN